jgi:hypothetical protein
MSHSETVEVYCTRRSWRLRLRPADARWLIGLAARQLPDRPSPSDQDRLSTWHERLEQHLQSAVRQKYQNPAVAWVLLNVIVPIIVQLVLKWWQSRKE